MRRHRLFWSFLRLWAVVVLLGLGVVSAYLVTGGGTLTPESGLWVGMGGFIVIALGMLVLVQMSRDSGP